MADRLTLTLAADSSQLTTNLNVATQAMKAAERQFNSLARTAAKTGDALDLAKAGQAGAAFIQTAKGVDTATKALEGAAKAGEQLNKTVSLNRGGLMELQAAGVNSFQALASGMDVFRVAMMEGAQVLGGLVQGGVVSFSSMSAGLAAVAGSALTAVAGLAYLGIQAVQAQQQVRQISTSLALIGENVPKDKIEAWASALSNAFNISKSEANEVVKAFAGIGKLTMEQRQRLSELAVAQAQASGKDPSKLAEEWAKMAESGSKGLMQLADQLHLSTIEIKKFQDAGNEPMAIARAIDDISARIEKQVGLWARLKGAFDAFISVGGNLGAEGTPGVTPVAPPAPSDQPGPSGARRVPRVGAGVDYSGLTDDIRTRFEQMLAAMPEELAKSVVVSSGARTTEQQAEIRRRHEAMPGGVAAHPAALPGQSRHETGSAIDFSASAEADAWMRSHMGAYGLNTPVPNDPNHIQIAGGNVGASAAQGEKEAEELRTRVAAAENTRRAILHKNSLDAQVKDAEEWHDKMLKEHLAGSAEELAAETDLQQKKRALKDQGLELELARLNEESAATVDTAKKAEIAQRKIDVATKGGASPTEIQGLKTELAAAQRALTQEGIQLDVAKLRAAQQATKDPAERIALQKQIQAASTGRPVLEQAGLKTELEGMLRQQKEEAFRQSEQGVGAMISARGDQFRGFQAQQTAAVREGRITPLQSLDAQMAKSKELADENAAALNALGAQATSNTDQIKIYWELWREGVRAATETQQLLNEKAQETKKLVDGWAAPFKSAFNSMESSISSGLSGLITGATTWGKTMTNIGTRLVDGVVDTGLNTLSKFAAKAIDATATGTLGDLAGKFIGENLLKLAPSAVADTTGVATTTAAMGTMTAATTTAMGTMTATVATAMAAMASAVAGGEAAQTTAAVADAVIPFAKGGIVPSAAGGWALPSYPGTQPALLHAKEMVLPAHISEGLQSAIGKGGGLGGGVTFNLNAVAADGPAIERLFRSNGRLITDAVKSGVRNNALTPRSI
jgi:hypothetical protein